MVCHREAVTHQYSPRPEIPLEEPSFNDRPEVPLEEPSFNDRGIF
jgi:hypothetical protein